ncbi:MAG: response regulator transcription factor, partial [Bacteroidales bacterium]|nr:response regulator transcription factor [Bacteroidales bacterium]
APVLGLLIGFSMGMILNGDMINTVIVVGILVLVAGIVVYVRMQNRKLLRDQIVYAREQQVYSTRKSLSALEVRSEMTEKDLLGKLEMKRKELVDFAVGISEQKDFMENVYEQLEDVRRLDSAEEKDARTDEILSSLRERMYFTREINDFYARSEVLHKDFNMRLREAYPNLTENERKLANLLRQGFSSKYIASLMNITPKSAEINRYRLRLKLGLQRSDNLIKFIKSI